MHQWTNINYWFRQWLVAWPAPSHYLNQCWNIVNWTLRNKFQWNLKQNSYIFIQENALENVVWKIAAILSLPQCVNPGGLICFSKRGSCKNPIALYFKDPISEPLSWFLTSVQTTQVHLSIYLTTFRDRCFKDSPWFRFHMNKKLSYLCRWRVNPVYVAARLSDLWRPATFPSAGDNFAWSHREYATRGSRNDVMSEFRVLIQWNLFVHGPVIMAHAYWPKILWLPLFYPIFFFSRLLNAYDHNTVGYHYYAV